MIAYRVSDSTKILQFKRNTIISIEGNKIKQITLRIYSYVIVYGHFTKHETCDIIVSVIIWHRRNKICSQ